MGVGEETTPDCGTGRERCGALSWTRHGRDSHFVLADNWIQFHRFRRWQVCPPKLEDSFRVNVAGDCLGFSKRLRKQLASVDMDFSCAGLPIVRPKSGRTSFDQPFISRG